MIKKTIIGLSVCTVTLFAQSEPFHIELDIYTNKSFLSKSFKLKKSGKITTKVPASTNLLDIKYHIGKKCTINGAILSQDKKVKDELSKRIDKLINQKNTIDINIQALLAKEKLLKSLSLEKQSDFNKIDKITKYLMQNLIINSSDILKLQKKSKKIEDILKNSNVISRKYKNLEVAYTCKKSKKSLEISYPQDKLRFNSFYDINANINAKTVTIDKRAKLNYKGIENFNNIDINLYSYIYNQNIQPQKFYPKYLNKKSPAFYKQAKSMIKTENSMMLNAKGSQIQHQDLNSKSVYNIRNTKLLYGDKNIFHVDTEVTNANFKTVIDAYGTSKAYLQASIKTQKNYPKGYAKIYLNSNPIASKYMQEIKKDTNTKIYFAEDEHIQIKKELIKTLDEKTFFGDKSISTLKWEYKIINTKPSDAQISFINRVPVSKDANIVVKTLLNPQPTSTDAKGKLKWDFNLKSKETKKIIFGYEISKRIKATNN